MEHVYRHSQLNIEHSWVEQARSQTYVYGEIRNVYNHLVAYTYSVFFDLGF
jgi:hypothetical protein